MSGDFRRPDGSPAYPMFDLAPLRQEPDLEFGYVDPVEGVMRAADLDGFDALILLTPRFDERSIPDGGRMRLVARFGVGYDNVAVEACTEAGIALVITPDGVRRPMAVTVLTLRARARLQGDDEGPLDPAGTGRLGAAKRPYGAGPHRPHPGPARYRQHRRRGIPRRRAPRDAPDRA